MIDTMDVRILILCTGPASEARRTGLNWGRAKQQEESQERSRVIYW